MEIQPPNIAGVELIGPDAPQFHAALEALFGREPDELLNPAVPWSVIVRNCRSRAIALLGLRFDMTGPRGRFYSVVHYADTLRHPEKAALAPGAMRFVCAEPLYTDLVLRRAREIDARGPMNLENLRGTLRIGASVDCVAFDDGRFEGPDSLGAFERLEIERAAEIAFIEEFLNPQSDVEAVLAQALEIPPTHSRDHMLLTRRTLARRLHEALATGGLDEALARARNHRPRIPLRRV